MKYLFFYIININLNKGYIKNNVVGEPLSYSMLDSYTKINLVRSSRTSIT